jgi:hypothetical protein
LIYALVGVALGIMTGTALAAVPWGAYSPIATPELVQASSNATGLSSHPIAKAGQTPALDRKADSRENEQLSSALKSVAGKTSATHRRHAVRWLSVARKFSARHKSSSRCRPQFSRAALATVPSPAAGNVLRLDAAAEQPLFIIEGDVTVADYDASQGLIATYDGRSSVTDRTTGEGNATSWEDYRANIHYRCDRSGNCTLSRAGLIIHNAKLAI